MKRSFVILLCAFAGVSVLASQAIAFTATLSPAGAVESNSLGNITFAAGETTIACAVSWRGRVDATITIGVSIPIGQITSIAPRSCTNGATVTVLALPYELTYAETLGTYPDNATGLTYKAVGASFNLSLFGGFVNCLYRGDQRILLALTDTGTNTYRTGLETLIGTALRKVSGFGCPAEGEMAGSFSLTAQTLTVR